METEFRRMKGFFLSLLRSCSNESKKLLKEPRFFLSDRCCFWAERGGGRAEL